MNQPEATLQPPAAKPRREWERLTPKQRWSRYLLLFSAAFAIA